MGWVPRISRGPTHASSGVGPRRRNPVKLAGMTDDLLLLIFTSAALAGGYKIWQISLDARAAANRIAKDTCSRAVVQFLDGTVALPVFG